MPAMPWLSRPPVDVALPTFSRDEGELLQELVVAVGVSELADTMDGMLASDVVLAGRQGETAAHLTVGQLGMDVATSLPYAHLWSSNDAPLQPARTLSIPRDAAALPSAWAVRTAVYRREGRYVSTSTPTARELADFHRVALARPEPEARKAYEQYLYVVGTQAAVDEVYVANEAERAACRARLGCLLGATGGQLLASYRELEGERRRTGQATWALATVGLALLALSACVPRPLDIAAQAGGGPSATWSRPLCLGGASTLLAAAAVGALIDRRHNAEREHVDALALVREVHQNMLVQPQFTRAERRGQLMALRDQVTRQSHPVRPQGGTHQTLVLRPIAQQALDEMYAYWLPDVAESAPGATFLRPQASARSLGSTALYASSSELTPTAGTDLASEASFHSGGRRRLASQDRDLGEALASGSSDAADDEDDDAATIYNPHAAQMA